MGFPRGHFQATLPPTLTLHNSFIYYAISGQGGILGGMYCPVLEFACPHLGRQGRRAWEPWVRGRFESFTCWLLKHRSRRAVNGAEEDFAGRRGSAGAVYSSAQGLMTGTERSSKCDVLRVASVA